METTDNTNESLFTMLEQPNVQLFKARGLIQKLESREVGMGPDEKHRLDKLRHKTRRELNIALRTDS